MMMITKKGEGGRSRGKLEAEKDEALKNILLTMHGNCMMIMIMVIMIMMRPCKISSS